MIKQKNEKLVDENNISVIAESPYLIKSNKEKCKKIIGKEPDVSPNSRADFLISLHLVLELSLNALLREIIVNNLQKKIDKSKIVNNLDKISFIEKITLFVYMEKYKFDYDEIEKADEYHSIIGKMKEFSKTRNLLMHGSMIGSFLDDHSSPTTATSVLTPEHMNEQIENFKYILEGVKFYLNHLKNCTFNKKELIDKFLNTDFLSKQI
ncbi:MAG: hypothetical protein ACKKL6_00595 [Candidatus Komeilibacteria bacterium]